MEVDNSPSSTGPSTVDKLHLSNIQFLAAVDCALAVTSLIFNCRQLTLTIQGVPHTSFFEEETGDDAGIDVRLLVAAVASVCLTLTQLLLACSVLMTVSDKYHLRRRTRIVSGMWVCWSGVLLIMLVLYAFSMKRFENLVDKFYLFMLISEILLRIVIIHYTCIFFLCKFNIA